MTLVKITNSFIKKIKWYSTNSPMVFSWIFQKTLGKLNYYQKFSPDIEILSNYNDTIHEVLENEKNKKKDKPLRFLDIGARNGVKADIAHAQGFDYHAIDINPQNSEVITGDICNCPDIADNSFDIVFSLDVLEHVANPWEASKECIRITKPDGLIIHRTLFSYRYHPCPNDYWRFSSQGLEHLFIGTGKAKTILKGYDLRGRRRDRRGNNLNSSPPVDYLGGFRENWQVLWIGRKNT